MGIFDRGPSAVLGELLGGVFGINQAQAGPAQVPLPQRNPAQDRVPDPNGVVSFMEANGIPFTDGGIETAIRIMSQRQGLTPSQGTIDQSIFSPMGGAQQPAPSAVPPGAFTDPNFVGVNPQLTPAQTAQDQLIQQQVENDNRNPQQFDNAPFPGPTITAQDQGPQTATNPNVVGQGQGFSRVPVDAIVDFAEKHGIPLTDGGIHEAARAVMGDGYDFDLIEQGIRGGATNIPDEEIGR
jgi:hypothetical protein